MAIHAALNSVQKAASSPSILYAVKFLSISYTLFGVDRTTKEYLESVLFSRLQHPIFSELSEDIAPPPLSPALLKEVMSLVKRTFHFPSFKRISLILPRLWKQTSQPPYSSTFHLLFLFHKLLLRGQTRKSSPLLLILSRKKRDPEACLPTLRR